MNERQTAPLAVVVRHDEQAELRRVRTGQFQYTTGRQLAALAREWKSRQRTTGRHDLGPYEE